ncbi:MAG: antibiotic biosynthesis monooxygenase [Rhodobacteraceae bacterium]|nr:antibiotic biosynthesis monooxygenase [Paracoccaceae bacterium]
MAINSSGPKTILSGYVLVPPERLAAVCAALPRHIELTRQEPGCLFFDVTENPDQPGRLDVYEEFADRAAFDAHQFRAAQSDWAAVSKGLPRHYKIFEK